MAKALDITGERFGSLVALSKAASRNGKTYWLCRCDCGNEKEVQTTHLRNGSIKSCGCAGKANTGKVVIDFRKRMKEALVEGFGHKCHCCGLVDHPVVYDFHHINPSTKSFALSGSNTHGKASLAKEAKKCVMLCSICHRKVECGLIPNEFICDFDEKKFYEVIEQ